MRATDDGALIHARIDLNHARVAYRLCRTQVRNAKVSWKMAERYYPHLVSTWASVHGRWLSHCRGAKKELRQSMTRVKTLLEATNGAN